MHKQMFISSFSNDKVQFVKKLRDKKFRTEAGLFVCEGVNLVRDLPSTAQPDCFFVTEEREQEFKPVFERFSAPVYVTTSRVFASLAETESPYGVLAVVKALKREFCLPQANALLLDGVSDGGNLGTILRTACACGFNDVYLLDCADAYNGKAVRASLGAVLKLRIYQVNVGQAVALTEATQSLALDMGGESLFDCSVTAPVLLLAGSEAHGLRDEVLSNAKRVVSLPMQDMESLNVAVATGVAAYHIAYGGIA